MQTINLQTNVIQGLVLDDPFMVASSHHTDNEKAFVNLLDYYPAAVTLKTISNKAGGSGVNEKVNRERAILTYPGGNRLGIYTDGPKKLELWDAPTGLEYLQQSQKVLSKTKLGISVRQGEDYKQIAATLDLGLVTYAELNWKYTFRGVEFTQQAVAMRQDLENFIDAFAPKPILVKVPNELLPFLHRKEMQPIYELLADRHCGLLLANTKRAVVPPSRQKSEDRFYDRGVIYGEQLFLDTFNALLTLTKLKGSGWKVPQLVATGGITDIGAVIDVVAAGAEAVQLCSILDYRKALAIDILRRQLRKLIFDSGVKTFEEFKAHLREQLKTYLRQPEPEKNIPANWLKVSKRSRSMETHHERVMESIESNRKLVLECMAETLTSESVSALPAEIAEVNLGAAAQKLTFLINRSIVGAFVITHRMVRKLDCLAATVDDSNGVLLGLKQKDATFDIAILARRVVEEINRSYVAEGRPEPLNIVGKVGHYVFEVVGTTAKLDAIQTLFHFTGTGSREALKVLLSEMKPKPILRAIEDAARELAPFLAFWDSRDAILARGPLTRLYKLLMEGEARKHWKSVREIKDDLVLVNTSRFSGDAGQLNGLLGEAIRTSHEIHTDPAAAARQAYDLGYMNHIANMLGANVLA